ncbi:MAG TPA: hypothetical protein VGQ00_01780 [Candidatus Norongarragalinales archaeon]|jgi:hypothetical protein|nr:hypothetical protein [Candidatus Norongarragalinales archaeon]
MSDNDPEPEPSPSTAESTTLDDMPGDMPSEEEDYDEESGNDETLKPY